MFAPPQHAAPASKTEGASAKSETSASSSKASLGHRFGSYSLTRPGPPTRPVPGLLPPIQLQRHKVAFELKQKNNSTLEGFDDAKEHLYSAFEGYKAQKKQRDADMHKEHLANLAKLESENAGDDAKRAEVARFEQLYNQSRGYDVGQLRHHLRSAWGHEDNPVKKELRFGEDGSVFVRVKRTPNSKKYDEHHLGQLFEDNERFVKTHDADAATGLRERFQKRGKYEGEHQDGEYVEDAAGTKIKRFLLRNLSDNDSNHMFNYQNHDLRARHGRMPGNPDESQVKQHILHHLRGTKKNDNSGDYEPRHFISTTSTRKDIFGSTGSNFYSPTKGRALIDAARIPQQDVYDVHRQESVNKWVTGRPQRWDDHYSGSDKSKNLAARDTVRTREVLIHGAIPERAIVDKWKWTGEPGPGENVTGKYRMKGHDEADANWYDY